jgi:hypothetical protein
MRQGATAGDPFESTLPRPAAIREIARAPARAEWGAQLAAAVQAKLRAGSAGAACAARIIALDSVRANA